MEQTNELIIIGSGPAALTAGIYAARAHLAPLIFSGNEPGGQLITTTTVDNWPGDFHILGPDLMKKMRQHAVDLEVRFVDDSATAVDFKRTPFSLSTQHSGTHYARSIIIATGATPKRLGCPGEDTYWGKGVSTCAICDGTFYKDKRVIIVGGGDTAMEHASFLRNFTNNITIVHIGSQFTASPAMQQRIAHDRDIVIIYNSTVTAIHGSDNKLTGATVTDQTNQNQTDLPADGIFIAIGLTPNTQFLEDQIALNSHGYIIVSDDVKTSVPGVFAAGDVHDFLYRQAITAAGSGCMAALQAERYLAKSRT
jgi:thioredoxin reductase (NADPH)